MSGTDHEGETNDMSVGIQSPSMSATRPHTRSLLPKAPERVEAIGSRTVVFEAAEKTKTLGKQMPVSQYQRLVSFGKMFDIISISSARIATNADIKTGSKTFRGASYLSVW